MLTLSDTTWRPGPGDSWILDTPEGELLWAVGSDRKYKKAFGSFAAGQGLAGWSGREWHVDHLLSRAAQQRRYPTGYDGDLHVLVLTPAEHNTAWSSWERRAIRRNNVLDLWLVAKASGRQPVLKRRRSGRAERWLTAVQETAPLVSAAVNLPTPVPGYRSLPDTPHRRLSDLMLGRQHGEATLATEEAEHNLLEAVIETWLPDRVDMGSRAEGKLLLARRLRALCQDYERLTRDAAEHWGEPPPRGQWQMRPDATADGQMFSAPMWLPA